MKITNVYGLYFSPTDNTKKITEILSAKIASELNVELDLINITGPSAREWISSFKNTDLVVIGFPVYAGRIPNKILPYLQDKIKGNHALAVAAVTYGNRSFDNGLSELRDELENHEFHTIAALAAPCEHAFTDKLAPGRPDETDIKRIEDFGKRIAELSVSLCQAPDEAIVVPGDSPAEKYYTPLGTDGKPAVFLKAKPKTDPAKCTGCGFCAKNCPMGSISADPPFGVTGICIKCQSCIRKCPSHAKYFDDERFLSHVKMLETNYRDPKDIQFFI